MTSKTLRSVRYSFVMFLAALTTYTVVESAVGGPAALSGTVAEGLSTCGTADQPCALEPVAVSVKAAQPAQVQLAADEGLSACGTEARPCRLEAVEVTAAHSGGHLASVEHAVGMTLRVKS